MILHSSLFILHFAIGKLSHCESLALTAPKVMFGRMKHGLSHDETWSFAQPICKTTLYEKPQKLRYLRPKMFLFRKMALIWGQNSNII